jgi:hypothetical protein
MALHLLVNVTKHAPGVSSLGSRVKLHMWPRRDQPHITFLDSCRSLYGRAIEPDALKRDRQTLDWNVQAFHSACDISELERNEFNFPV